MLKLENVASGMKITDKNNFTCETCILGKQVNIRNKEPDVHANSPFELINIDLAGPIDPVAKDGFRYCMIFADDYSGCLFTYFLRSKSDSVKALNKFLADISPYGKIKTLNFCSDILPSGDIKRMRSDNGGEFVSNVFNEILVSNHIKHEYSAPLCSSKWNCRKKLENFI